MKKRFMFVVLLNLVSISSFAFPLVGDSAQYKSGSGASVVTTQSEIIAVDGSGGYTKRDATSIGSEVITIVSVVNASSALATLLLIQSATSSTNCQNLVNSASDGSVASLEMKLVAGSMIPVCHIHYPTVTQSDGSNATADMWFGDVPFGLIEGKTAYADGSSFTSELTAFVKH